MPAYEEFIILASAKPELKRRIQLLLERYETDEAAAQYAIIALAEEYGYSIAPGDFSAADVAADNDLFDEDNLDISDRGVDYEKMFDELDDDEEEEY